MVDFAKKATKKAVETKEVAVETKAPIENEIVAFNEEAMFLADAGAGQEEMTREDFAIPRLTILQALSPQINASSPDFAKYEYLNAKPGMIYDSVTSDLYPSKGVIVLPVSYRRAYIEWKLRTAGGGFVKDHGTDPSILEKCTRDDQGKDILPNGNNIVTTAEYFAFIIDEEKGSFRPVVISMQSTQLKKAGRLNVVMRQYQVEKADGTGTFNPAIFYRSFAFATMPESDKKNNSWFGWDIKPYKTVKELKNGLAIYQAAQAFRDQVRTGAVKVAEAHVEISESDDDAY